DALLHRRVAIKFPHGAVGVSETTRWLAEARALAGISHPNIIPVLDVGIHDGQPFLVMELIAGTTLDRWIDETTFSSPRQRQQAILRQFITAGRALEAMHASGMLHRDFKPSNVLIGDDGRLRLFDLGLAHIWSPQETEAETDGMVGTPRYIAPELM